MNPDMVYAYVRDLLERLTGTRPQPDGDGDLPVVIGGAQFYVRVVNPQDPVVQVFSVAVDGVQSDAALFEELNAINTRLSFARAFHVGGQVLIESEMWGSDVNPANLSYACRTVATATDEFGSALAERFGGQPRFEKSKTEEYVRAQAEDAPKAPRMGFTSVLAP